MKKQLLIASACLLPLAACGQADNESYDAAGDAVVDAEMMQAAPPEAAAADRVDGMQPLPASMPKLAYAYGLSFELPSGDIGKLMRRHADQCERQGPQSCRIVGMDLSGSAENEDVHGTLQLAVAASHARAVSALLEDEAGDMGAEQIATTINSEEVSKSIVDTEARIRSREELRDRLQEVLRNRKGDVSELVEAERQVAAVNEEIDQARSWLAETQGRVSFSRMDIDYAPKQAAAASFTSPIAAAFSSLGGLMGYIIAALILLGAVMTPMLGIAWGVKAINRRGEGSGQQA